MQLQQAIQNVFVQLSGTLEKLSNDQYVYASQTLSNATIGQHVRHIIEMFICLEDGYEQGVVNYEKRKRDMKIETEKDFASDLLKKVYADLNKPNKALFLEATYNEDDNDLIRFDTNYHREIAYNLEHTIHHMALIKVGIREVSDLEIPDGFGVATSTIKYRKECAQ
ncbi:MAG: DinB family protein [Gemmatimonadaceae bacterium]|nr:DinB family protein [Chitinophagaceae bacterium]